MKTKRKEKAKLNNQGMSLVEILLAIILLSIALIPLLHGFIQVTKLNFKGRELQQTTIVAQTIMENFKAYDVDGIAKKFEDGDFLDGDYADDCVYQKNPGKTKFTVDKIKVDKNEYGAQILLTEVSSAKKNVLDFKNMNDKLDAVFVEDTSLSTTTKTLPDFEEEALKEVLETIQMQVALDTDAKGERKDLSTDDIFDSFFKNAGQNNGNMIIKRKIYITSEGTEGTNAEKVTVKFVYEFSPKNNAKYKCDISTETVESVWTAVSKEITFTIYTNVDSKDQGGKLEKIYFYYYPAYKTAVSSNCPCEEDSIYIKNDSYSSGGTARKDLDVYLIKMKKDGFTDSSILLGESSYAPKVNIENAGKVRLYTNLKPNLMDTSVADVWNEVTGLADTYNMLIPFDASNKTFPLVQTKEETLMYNIKINIFRNANFDASLEPDASKSEMVLTLDGSKINW